MKVADLKRVLKKALNQLENFEDNEKLKTSPDACDLGGYILEVVGGFISLNDIEIEDNDEDF